MEKRNIVFRAPLLSISGYGVHARQIAKWLIDFEQAHPDKVDLTFQLVKWGETAWHVNHNACDGLVREILSRSKREEGKQFDVSFQLQLPDEWDPFLATTNVGITAGVEATVCNPGWIDAINRMDMVVVPSEFTKSTFENTGTVITPVVVIPESFFEECKDLKKAKPVDLNIINTNFNFLIVSQFTGNNPENDRKNLAYTMKWMIEEFKDEPDVGIIIKTNFGRQTAIDKQKCVNAIGQLVMQVQRTAYPKIHLLHGHMTKEEMVGLYTHDKVKALVSLTRGEGFGLPILEAAACGLPVITTGWSAHTEFLKNGKYVKVEYDLNKVHPSRVDGRIFMENSRWANPDEKDAKRKLRRFKKSPAIPAGWAKDLRKSLIKLYSPEAVNKIYTKEFGKLILEGQ